MLANTGKDGFLSEFVVQHLIFKSEPDASYISSVEAATDSEIATIVNGRYIDQFRDDSGNGPVYILKKGEPISVTYTGLKNSSFDGKEISKVVYTYTLKSTELDNKDKILVNFQNDPTKTLYYWIDGQETVINMDVKFYDATDKILNTSGSLLSFASLNTAIVDLDYEAISNFIGEFIEITGSGIKVVDGVARAIASNRYTEEGSKFFEAEWDYDGSPLEYYGAIVGRTTSETINFDISSKGRNYVWFAFNTNVKAP
ncbi:GbpC/Spa domain-containing protein, partial [Streptococcus suis]